VDPLDGTTNYLYGLAGFNVSIGVEVNDQPAAGAVYDIARDELFSASLGGGATRNGETIQTTSARHLPHALVGTGFSYEPEQRHRQAQVLVTLLPRVRDIRRQGAAALDLCSVACGRLDAYYEQGLAPWDVAAGGLIASEAGAAVTNVAGDAVTAGTVVAAAPGIAPALRRLLRTAGVTDT
jgi:myo-inositol-1(or 4)-monophosphatase